MKKLILILLTTILLSGCSKKTEIIGSDCECYLKFNENWKEFTDTTEYETDDGQKIEKDYRIIGETKTCLAMWNKEKKMLLILSKFNDEETMKLEDDEILKIIKKNYEIENEFLGYKFIEQSEHTFLNKDFYVFVAERSVNGDYQVNLIEIEESECSIIEISGQNTEEIFEELSIIEKENQK